jgi:hypothetical protein
VRADRRHSENSTAEVVQNEKPDISKALDRVGQTVAGAGGIEPPNGRIKICVIIQRFQGAFGKMSKIPPKHFQ